MHNEQRSLHIRITLTIYYDYATTSCYVADDLLLYSECQGWFELRAAGLHTQHINKTLYLVAGSLILYLLRLFPNAGSEMGQQ